jgi:hypothetical protein
MFSFCCIFTIAYHTAHAIVALGYFVLAPIGFMLIGFGSKENVIKKFSLVTGIAALIAILVLPVIIFVLLRTRLVLKPTLSRRVFQADNKKSSHIFLRLFSWFNLTKPALLLINLRENVANIHTKNAQQNIFGSKYSWNIET